MITMFSIALLSAATANMEDIGVARDRYAGCLTDFVLEQLDLKTSANAFEKAAANACESEKNMMFSAMKNDEIEFGSTNQEATDYANEEVNGELFAVISSYGDYLESGSRPVKQ